MKKKDFKLIAKEVLDTEIKSTEQEWLELNEELENG